MYKAISSKQITVALDNRVGGLAEATSDFTANKINLIAISVYASGDKCFIQFVSENNNNAVRLLKNKGYDVTEEEVVLVSISNEPGSLQRITDKVANAGVDLKLLYGSVEKTGNTSRIVLVSPKPKALLNAIKGKW